MAKAMILLIWELCSQENIVVKKIRCENLGKNIAFQAVAKDEDLGLHFKFMACQTPQQNGHIE